ncbi:MAG TPA: sigma-70 family RNA polymerase sigma factor [Sphingomicrobium sp.]
MTGEIASELVRKELEKTEPGTDLHFLAKVRGGDRVAFEQLYRMYHPRLTRFLYTLVKRPTLVEEVLNDTMMVVWNRPDSFHGASKLSTWLFSIAYRKAMKALRKQDEPMEDFEAEHRVSLDPAPDDSSGRARVRQLLLEAVAELSPAHRAVVDLTYFHELGYREIAAVVECPVDTVKTRMFHARRHLRKKLGGVLADWI